MWKSLALSLIFALIPTLGLVGCDDGGGTTGPVCGNGVLENGEVCDLDQFGDTTCQSLGFDGGVLTCSATCEPQTYACESWTCGDGVVNPGEACDGTWGDISCAAAGYVFGTASCADDCTLDASSCSVPHGCGDGELGPDEPCDGSAEGGGVPDGVSCEAVGLLPGTVVCDRNCRLDYLGCGVPENPCGNGVLDPGEHCDGDALGGRTCEDRFYFGGGTLACRPNCTFDDSGCVAVSEGTTSSESCERGLPCNPEDMRPVFESGFLPHVCVRPFGTSEVNPYQVCLPACGDHADCPLGLVCLDDQGVGYCGEQPCDTPAAPCTLASGLPGLCTPVDFGRNLCRVSGLRQEGQSCLILDFSTRERRIPYFNFEFDPLETCVSGTCAGQSGEGVCRETLCDAQGVLDGSLADPCPPLQNCLNTSRLLVQEYGVPYRSADGGRCVYMIDRVESETGGFQRNILGRLACNALSGLTTRHGLPCPEGTGCVDHILLGSLYAECTPVVGEPLALGEDCSGGGWCGPGAGCVIADPLAAPYEPAPFSEYEWACRRACDAGLYADNPACAGLPEGTTWVCLSVTRFFTVDHGLTIENPNAPGGVEVLDPSPLGYCVPELSGGKVAP